MTPSLTIAIFVFSLPLWSWFPSWFWVWSFFSGCRIHLRGLCPPSVPHAGFPFWLWYQLVLGSAAWSFPLSVPTQLPRFGLFFDIYYQAWYTTYYKYFKERNNYACSIRTSAYIIQQFINKFWARLKWSCQFRLRHIKEVWIKFNRTNLFQNTKYKRTIFLII